MPYPPTDDRLRHLLAQRINCHVDTWKLAFFIAGAIVDDPYIRSELNRIADAHTSGQPCGDRNCRTCFEAATAAPATAADTEAQFGTEDCTCIPWTRKYGTPRYCGPDDTVSDTSGWARGADCPHHAPAEDST